MKNTNSFKKFKCNVMLASGNVSFYSMLLFESLKVLGKELNDEMSVAISSSQGYIVDTNILSIDNPLFLDEYIIDT